MTCPFVETFLKMLYIRSILRRGGGSGGAGLGSGGAWDWMWRVRARAPCPAPDFVPADGDLGLIRVRHPPRLGCGKALLEAGGALLKLTKLPSALPYPHTRQGARAEDHREEDNRADGKRQYICGEFARDWPTLLAQVRVVSKVAIPGARVSTAIGSNRWQSVAPRRDIRPCPTP
jgi:hypothetical protein